MREFFKKYHLYIIIVALSIGGILGITRSCNLSDRLHDITTQYKTYKAIYKEDIRLRDKDRNALIKRLEARDKEIKASGRVIHGLEKKLAKKEGVLKDLQGKYAEITTCPERVENLEAQVTVLERQFTLCRDVIAEKDKIIFSLKDKYETAMLIADSWEDSYNLEKNLRIEAEKASVKLLRTAKRQRFTGTLKTVLIGIAGGVILYMVVDK